MTDQKVRAATCSQCGGWTLVAAYPLAISDPETLREFAKAAQNGDSIGVYDVDDVRGGTLAACSCDRDKQPELFDRQRGRHEQKR